MGSFLGQYLLRLRSSNTLRRSVDGWKEVATKENGFCSEYYRILGEKRVQRACSIGDPSRAPTGLRQHPGTRVNLSCYDVGSADVPQPALEVSRRLRCQCLELPKIVQTR